MEQVKIWVLVGAVGGMWAIIILFANLGLKKLGEMVSELKELALLLREHSQQIKHLESAQEQLKKRLDNHSDRLRELEIFSPHKKHVET